MYRTALRTAPGALRTARPTLASSCRRLASTSTSTSTASPKKKGSWKGFFLRWAIAGYAVYFYNTSPLFADEQPSATAGPAPPRFSDEDLPTIDALIEEKRRQAALAAPPPPPPSPPTATSKAKPAEPEQAPTPAPTDEQNTSEKPAEAEAPKAEAPKAAAAETPTELEPGSPEALEHEATEQGAFNPETGEINWDCPCLGGMAHGPCGEEFKAAFSCFVYSKEEPKGMDCIDKFQDMQTCFRKYPEVYGSELADDDEEGGAPAEGGEAPAKTEESKAAGEAEAPASEEKAGPKDATSKPEAKKKAKEQ
ncbi:hypothetical protein VTJ83DRAFT_5202 [Remersonia thermophila]|uniref:Mitochondrial intermembrane space import and assembly protein 40 n=1 Tax=Remersonia thermophila TaxID=72144 RepID=A0ABR4DC53_9PEZI